MFNWKTSRNYLPLCFLLLSSSALAHEIDTDTIDISNVAASVSYGGRDYRAFNEYLQNLVDNPYSSPDYLFYQVEQLAKIIGSFNGKHYHLPSMVAHLDARLRQRSGQGIKDNWKNSLQKYMDKRDQVYNYHNYCCIEGDLDVLEELDELQNPEQIINIGWHSGYSEPITGDYDKEYYVWQVRNNKSIAPWTIGDIPPKITYSFAAGLIGVIMMECGIGEIAAIGIGLEVFACCMVVDYYSNEHQHKWDANQKKNNNGVVDIREGQMDMPYRR